MARAGGLGVSERETVVLADCFTRSGLAVARSLSRRGLRVIAVSRSLENLAVKSRRIDSVLIGPDPEGEPEAWVQFVCGEAESVGARLVIPITDQALAAFNGHRELIPAGVPVALPSAASVAKVLDKNRNLALARELGVPCPREFQLESREQVPQMIEALGFPLVVKDPEPDAVGRERPLPFRVEIARDADELEALLDIVDASDARPIYQSFVRGRSISLCTFAIDGELIASHAYVSERRSTHEGIARETVEPDPQLTEYVRRMIGGLEWTGVAHLQFFVDDDKGTCGYMETNGRFWASTQGSVYAGWDFPSWFYRAWVAGERPEVPPFRIGSRTVYRRADIEQLMRHLRHGSALGSGYSGTWSAVWTSLRDFRPGVHSDVWQWSDPRPALWDLAKSFSLGRIRGLLRAPNEEAS